MTPEELARRFHETYERLAPAHGYETRKESAKPWAEVPEKNKKLMTAVAAEILGEVNAMPNGVALAQSGRVSVLVFDTAKQRKSIGDLIANGPPRMTRIAISPNDSTDAELRSALAEVAKTYPLPT